MIDTIDVVIDADTLTKTFDVATYVDQLQEGSETFTAHIVSATNDNGAVNIGTADATGTILDNYNPPEVSIGTGISGGQRRGRQPRHVHRVPGCDERPCHHREGSDIQCLASDTATEGADYQLIDTIDVVIDANTLTKTFDVATYVDQLQEGSETFTAHIVSATNDNGAVTISAPLMPPAPS